MTFFEHMGVMVRRGRAVDMQGRDVYLDDRPLPHPDLVHHR